MTLYANTIEFAGETAVINSYSLDFIRAYDKGQIDAQRAEWAARFPNAQVQTVQLPEHEVRRLVAEGRARYPEHLQYAPWEVGAKSKAA